MSSGYREVRKEAVRRRQERFELAVAVAVALSTYVALDYFGDAVVAATGLTMLGSRTFAAVISFFLLWAVIRLLPETSAGRFDRR